VLLNKAMGTSSWCVS